MGSENCWFLLLVLLLECISTHVTGVKRDILSTKTSYLWSHDVTSPITKNEYTTVNFKGRTCTAVHVNGIFRHGLRYPSAGDMRDMTLLQNKLAPNVRNAKYDFLKTWNNTYPIDKANFLHDMGKEELHAIGSRLGKRLFSLIDGNMDTIHFVSSSTQRTKASAQELFSGLSLGVGDAQSTAITPQINDNLTRYFDMCKLYSSSVDTNITVLKEYSSFLTGDLFRNVISANEARLGLTNSSLSADDILMIYKTCAAELASYNRSDTWCSIQTDDEREILEYASDIEDYYLRGYGVPINTAMACPIVQDLVNSIEHVIHNHNHHLNYSVAKFVFGHSDTVTHLANRLSLFRDQQPLLASNFDVMRNRKYIVSHTTPFSANIVFVLYNCHQGNGRPLETDYILRLLVNDEPEALNCGDSICRYVDTDFRNIVGCNFDEICRNDNMLSGVIVG
ncbi:hypothetical protein CHS0354_018921 [Potamilus streckersoni]|uniref:Multiple inositol polyphosphate phosphatase 1 n=1 Tax=Potamilus streckersoni TaxID=2493646 RepID=A0AAE0VEW3_9BIVA|nr:hypothetical protein CHS0354_018921 [Potamilus streckersoni]